MVWRRRGCTGVEFESAKLSRTACKKPATRCPPRQQQALLAIAHASLSSQIHLRQTSSRPLQDLFYPPFWSILRGLNIILALTNDRLVRFCKFVLTLLISMEFWIE